VERRSFRNLGYARKRRPWVLKPRPPTMPDRAKKKGEGGGRRGWSPPKRPSITSRLSNRANKNFIGAKRHIDNRGPFNKNTPEGVSCTRWWSSTLPKGAHLDPKPSYGSPHQKTGGGGKKRKHTKGFRQRKSSFFIELSRGPGSNRVVKKTPTHA